MKHISLFSGIGGFDLAAEWMDWENVAHCELNEFCRKILNYYWPKSISYDDIKTTDFTVYRGLIDILTGGFPCQPYSTAGKRLGKEDARHLWPEMLRAIREIRPRWVVGENVRGLLSWNGGLVFDEVQADLEAEGYEVLPLLLPACAVNAPHKRERIWFVAHSLSTGTGNISREVGNEGGRTCEDRGKGIRQTYGKVSTSRADTASSNGAITNPSSFDTGWERRQQETDPLAGWNLCEHEQSGSEVRDKSGADAKDEFTPNSPNSRLESVQREWLDWVYGSGAFADPAGTGLPFSGQTGLGEYETQVGEGMDDRFEQLRGDASDAPPIGVQRSGSDREQKPQSHAQERLSVRRNSGTDWQNFPTQSPVCNGDDGFSSRLDAAAVFGSVKHPRQPARAFGKWRNESIKAGGNAIVPQVVYQIFKTIEYVDWINS